MRLIREVAAAGLAIGEPEQEGDDPHDERELDDQEHEAERGTEEGEEQDGGEFPDQRADDADGGELQDGLEHRRSPRARSAPYGGIARRVSEPGVDQSDGPPPGVASRTPSRRAMFRTVFSLAVLSATLTAAPRPLPP